MSGDGSDEGRATPSAPDAGPWGQTWRSEPGAEVPTRPWNWAMQPRSAAGPSRPPEPPPTDGTAGPAGVVPPPASSAGSSASGTSSGLSGPGMYGSSAGSSSGLYGPPGSYGSSSSGSSGPSGSGSYGSGPYGSGSYGSTSPGQFQPGQFRPGQFRAAAGQPNPYPGQPPLPPAATAVRTRRPGRAVAILAAVVVGSVVLGLLGVAGGYALGPHLPEAGSSPRQAASSAPGSGAAAPSATPTAPSAEASAPVPTSGPSIYSDQSVLVDNPLYPLTAPALECPGLALPVPSGGALEPWSRKAIECLHQHYQPILDKAGLELTMPTLTFYSSTIDTPCGEGDGAFYCGANEGIYVERGLYDAREGARLETVRMLLHEFSHHVQQRAGILDVGVAADREDYPVVSRRIELQVNCWSNLQLRGSKWLKWTAADEEWLKSTNSVNTDKLHGSAKSQRYWYDQTRNATTFGACNTWAVDASRVE